MVRFLGLRTEQGTTGELENEIFSYLVSQRGILSSMIERCSYLGVRIVSWLTGEKPVLIIGGEPGSGKSLLMGELTLRHNELLRLYPGFCPSLALVSYDRVHYLFLKRLAEMCGANTHDFLPEGETHPEARKLVTRILRDVLLFAICDLPEGTPIILEAPLIGHRGEAVVDELSTGGFPMQVLIVHSPAMQSRVLQQGEQQTRKTSAQELAIRQIHKGLLQQRGITSLSQQMQDSELAESWEQWLGYREGLVLTWNPADDEAGFLYTREALKAKKVSPDPLTPQEVSECTALRIELTLQTLPNVEAFATEVRRYRR